MAGQKRLSKWLQNIRKEAQPHQSSEKQMKSTVKYYYTPTKMANILERNGNTKSGEGCEATGMLRLYFMQPDWWHQLKLSAFLFCELAIPLLGIYPKVDTQNFMMLFISNQKPEKPGQSLPLERVVTWRRIKVKVILRFCHFLIWVLVI